MSGDRKIVVRAALGLIVAAGLVFQGGIAYAEPDAGSTVSGESSAASDATATGNASATADASSSASADAGASATAQADSSGAASAMQDATANAGSDTQASASADSEAEVAATTTADSTTSADAAAGGDPQGATTADAMAAAEGDNAADTPPTTEPEAPLVEEPSAPKPTKVPKADDSKRKTERSATASASSLASGFKAGAIISDQNFYNASAMTSAQVQNFLNQKVGRCTIGDPGREPGKAIYGSVVAQKCLSNSTHDSAARSANAYCKAFGGSKSESAASIISRVAKACSVSPRVLLIMLEKEQSLVTDTWPTARQFSVAMGYACPDSGPGNTANCNSNYFGFANQVYYGAWQLQVYKAHPNNYNYKPFQTNTIQWHPNVSCGTSQVYIENWATAALYIYTPYRPNQAALDAGWGTGDACSSYGNRNFYQFYKTWFGTPTSTFPDVPPGANFYTEIEWMASAGITKGVKAADGRVLYMPKSVVTRGQMAAFLYRLKGANYTPPANSPFTDVKPGDKFYKEITWMRHVGYAKGVRQANGTYKFVPNTAVTREAVAAFLYRMSGSQYVGPAKSPFADMKPGDKFYNQITWMKARGITNGAQSGSVKIYAPKNSVTREAMAAFFYRYKH